jgi:ribosomal protein S18 acetylase RimI-like enzyme
MSIANLNESDIDNCLALMELVKDDFAGYKRDEFIKMLHNAIAEKEAFIAYNGEEIAGLIAFTHKDHEITFLAVSPHFRHKGIAKRLIGEVVNRFRPGDMLQVVTFRGDDPKGAAAVACYHSCGFKDDKLLEVYGYPCQRMIRWV